VAARILEFLPKERIIYFADSAHVPYGERPLDEIREFALGITEFLVEKGAKAVVMACNMSSAVALDTARERFPDIPMLGMIVPGSRAAIKAAGTRPIGVLATTGTVNSGAYERVITQIDPQRRVVSQACPAFVPLVESGQAGSEEAEAAACTYVAPLRSARCGTIVLGCTHYPFVRRAIESAVEPDVRIVDPAIEVTRELGKVLIALGIASSRQAMPSEFYASRDAEIFADMGSLLLGSCIDHVSRAEWGVDLGLRVHSL
jgi:glutamate racemase